MPEGTINKLTNKGFGFIKTSGADDLFFHSSTINVMDGFVYPILRPVPKKVRVIFESADTTFNEIVEMD